MIGFAFGFWFAAQKAGTDVLDICVEVLGNAKDLLLCELVTDLLVQLLEVVAVAD